MAYKCINCGINDVNNDGDYCPMCMGNYSYSYNDFEYGEEDYNSYGDYQSDDSYDSYDYGNTYVPKNNHKRNILVGGNTANYPQKYDSGKNQIQPTNKSNNIAVHGSAGNTSSYSTGSVASANNSYAVSGIVSHGIARNIKNDKEKWPFMIRFFKSLFTFKPLSIFDDITVFQVYPDYTGQSSNANGYQCDQIMIYGKVTDGQISENNTVDIYGSRDSNNMITAKKIINTASGSVITPSASISPILLWIIALLIVALCIGIVSTLGLEGIIVATIVIFCIFNLDLTFRIIGFLIKIILASAAFIIRLLFR